MCRLLALLLLLPLSAAATESAPVRSARATATLAADRTAVAPGEEFRVGLRLRLAPGWHSYWRNPGDAGAAPEVTLTLPEGATHGPILWPAPSRMPFGPLMNFGYAGEVLLPMAVSVPASATPGSRFRLEAEASWLVCETICIPEEGRFVLDLPVVAPPGRPDPALAPLFARTEAAVPRPSPWPAAAGASGRRAEITLTGPDLTQATVREAAFFPDGPALDNPAPQPLAVRDGALTLGLTLAEGAAVPARLPGVVVITDGSGVRRGFTVDPTVGVLAAAPGLALWQALLWGLLGGLILNLMPCVFPILAMKAMALARLSGAARAEVRAHAASYTAGVVLSFLALGGMLVGLRAAGVVAGWGFQFTAPVFVAALAWLMLAVGLNLSGVYGIGGAVGAGAGLAARGGHAGSFATGALAVLVATPCTAPFMAAAVAAALAMPAAATLAVFAALGLGLAAPYALLGMAPGLARHLPRPGGWMERLRQGLAFPMYGAAAWLAWVLAQQAGPEGLGLALAGAVLVGFAAWALGAAQQGGGRLGRGAALVAVLGALALLPGLAAAPTPAAAATPGAEAWTAERVAALQAEGRPVFVNLTAAWCITCQVNERLVLRSAAVQQGFAAHNIAYLKGDWTKGDPAISALIRAQGREGVPLYLLYPAGGGAPVLLPEVLTEGIVLRAIGAAGA